WRRLGLNRGSTVTWRPGAILVSLFLVRFRPTCPQVYEYLEPGLCRLARQTYRSCAGQNLLVEVKSSSAEAMRQGNQTMSVSCHPCSSLIKTGVMERTMLTTRAAFACDLRQARH